MSNDSERFDGRPIPEEERPSVPDLSRWLCGRSTVREYDVDADISDETIRELVDAGRKAPTSGTLQMYSFLWVRDQKIRKRIHDLCERGSVQIEEASHFLLVCIDLRRTRLQLEHVGGEFDLSLTMALLEGAIDASLAAGATMIAAESRGYGVCPIGNILTNLDAVARAVDVPRGVLPIYGLCIGVPRDGAEPDYRPRFPLRTVLHEGQYEDPDPELLAECIKRMDEIYEGVDRTWIGRLERYWGPDGFMNDREEVLLAALRQQGFFDYSET